jgi:hypothetical protein
MNEKARYMTDAKFKREIEEQPKLLMEMLSI